PWSLAPRCPRTGQARGAAALLPGRVTGGVPAGLAPQLLSGRRPRGYDRLLPRPRARLLVAEGDPSPAQVVRAQLHPHLIADQDADVELAHLAGGVGEDVLPGLEAHLEHGVGQGLDHRGIHLNRLLLDLGGVGGVSGVTPPHRAAPAGDAWSRWTSRQSVSSYSEWTQSTGQVRLPSVARHTPRGRPRGGPHYSHRGSPPPRGAARRPP